MSTAKNIVSWSDDYALDLPEIDEQHKVLFVLINKLWNQIVGQGNNDAVLKLLGELEHYTISHFTAEETFMRVTNYPGFPEHKAAHEKFVARIAQERTNVTAGKALTLDILRFLKDWLVDHILVADKAYAQLHRNKSETGSLLGRFFKRLF